MAQKKSPEFGPTQRLEREYASGIRSILKRVLRPKANDQSFQEWIAMLQRRSQEPDIQAASRLLAIRMIKWTSIGNARTWRQAAAQVQQSRKLYKLLETELQGKVGAEARRILEENTRLISGIPVEVAQRVRLDIAKMEEGGARPETVAKALRTKFPSMVGSRIRMISRTEPSKASAALTRARATDLGAVCYIWRTSEDVRVRKSHAKMDGVVIFYADPPSPEALIGEGDGLGHYHAGEAPNDRCTQIVVLTLDDIKFPARVYRHGAIKSMNKQEFMRIAPGLEERAAAA